MRKDIKEKLTNATDERLSSKLFTKAGQFSIPYFQRRYKWNAKRVERLADDLIEKMESNDGYPHFMGAIIMHRPYSKSGDTQQQELIDGQQRVCTLFLGYLSICEKLATEGFTKEAVKLMKLRLFTDPDLEYKDSNITFLPANVDRLSVNVIIQNILAISGVMKEFDNDWEFDALNRRQTSERSNINPAYRAWQEKITTVFGSDPQIGKEALIELSEVMMRQTSFVEIVTVDPSHGPKVYDRLNARGETLTLGELVKNDIFSRADTHDEQSLKRLHDNNWFKFHKLFLEDKIFERYLFPYGLLHLDDDSINKSEVYLRLQESWTSSVTPKDIINELKEYQNDFLDIVLDGSDNKNYRKHPKKLTEMFERFRFLKAGNALDSFLMKVSYEVHKKNLQPSEAVKALKIIESFLVRRGICGFTGTGLLALFRSLWDNQSDRPENTFSERVAAQIRSERNTHTWPTDAAVKDAIETRSLYGTKTTLFILYEFDKKTSGGHQPADKPQIEHLLPQTIEGKQCWEKNWKNRHMESVHRIGNLALLTKKLNSTIRNSCWDEKRKHVKSFSVFKSTRELAVRQKDWLPKDLEKRSKTISKFVLDQWKDGP